MSVPRILLDGQDEHAVADHMVALEAEFAGEPDAFASRFGYTRYEMLRKLPDEIENRLSG